MPNCWGEMPSAGMTKAPSGERIMKSMMMVN
jgi:hypothetical protein